MLNQINKIKQAIEKRKLFRNNTKLATLCNKHTNKIFHLLIFLLSIFGFILFFVAVYLYIFKYIPFIIKQVTLDLGLPLWLSILVICIFSLSFPYGHKSGIKIYGLSKINIPLYLAIKKNNKVRYHSWILWKFRKYREDFKYVGINVVGGLIPISIACWQFNRVDWHLIVLVIVSTTPLFYFSAKVYPCHGITISQSKLLLIVLFVSTLAMYIGNSENTGAIAYAGITLGSLMGAIFLHLKDLQLIQASSNLNIGVAGNMGITGIDAGIVSSGLYTLLATELIKKIIL